jgi:hypothetical protein
MSSEEGLVKNSLSQILLNGNNIVMVCVLDVLLFSKVAESILTFPVLHSLDNLVGCAMD